jgi:hypothetical protein
MEKFPLKLVGVFEEIKIIIAHVYYWKYMYVFPIINMFYVFPIINMFYNYLSITFSYIFIMLTF